MEHEDRTVNEPSIIFMSLRNIRVLNQQKKLGMTVGPVFFCEILGYLAIKLDIGMVN